MSHIRTSAGRGACADPLPPSPSPSHPPPPSPPFPFPLAALALSLSPSTCRTAALAHSSVKPPNAHRASGPLVIFTSWLRARRLEGQGQRAPTRAQGLQEAAAAEARAGAPAVVRADRVRCLFSLPVSPLSSDVLSPSCARRRRRARMLLGFATSVGACANWFAAGDDNPMHELCTQVRRDAAAARPDRGDQKGP